MLSPCEAACNHRGGYAKVSLECQALVGIHSNQQTHFTVKEVEHPALRLLSMQLLFMASLPDGTLKEGVSV